MSSKQVSVGSGFGPETTATQAIGDTDLRGKIAVVTGGYSGLGLETTRVLANAGATVLVPARRVGQAREALQGIANVEIEPLDLMDPASIDIFAFRFNRTERPLHILINNAGIMASPLLRDGRGYEAQFSTNHLGHFQLVNRLWPGLTRAKTARVVSLSSRGYQLSGVDFEDPNFERREYNKWTAYGQSKTANILFAVALNAKAESHGITAFAVHPGGILTELARHLSHDEIAAFGIFDEIGKVRIDPANDIKTVEQGTATTIWCATSPQLDGIGGVYCENCDVANLADPSKPSTNGGLDRGGVLPWAVSPQDAEKLWDLSERLSGTTLEL
ncbi:oxidoreductase [Candidatus Phyllobacterium onerii]|uniref:oxidoreductase n=1 Tax=Candidatus Phyllobacterium onerii TaxID=3020828 RepID=UPI0023310F6F|nr:oxidoreductase [Phyllobacterium sp. IY22]